ncbi:hypothetical protein [Georgenia yuyongxinii]|uniref:Cellulase (Glycosyl hydrolase family 5) n=1 Tax=Georgenia yuyongxinii TaxID=2589797 RepID=A0A552WPB1_9MICO|nr:hypothetical protein [Georgenia yuyongxinii]TRW44504.1 hypothetical protein FJ693_13280 [Georgenia yuyongxinii]
MATHVQFDDERILIDGRPTYEGRAHRDTPVEGLLFNARLVQGLFDDLNEETRGQWAYPDTGEWDTERNLREFLAHMPVWRDHGLLGLTLNLQCGNPIRGTGAGGVVPLDQPWHVSAYRADGTLREDWLRRLAQILDEADRLGMVVILGLFYFGQDHRLRDAAAVRAAAENVIGWLDDTGRRNVIVEVANECNVPRYRHELLQPAGIVTFIQELRAATSTALPLSASWAGVPQLGTVVPSQELLDVVDVALVHGNEVHDPADFAAQIRSVRERTRRRPVPIVVNEDNHFDFDTPGNHLDVAVENYASWGYFDPGAGGDYNDGFQCPPVNWGLTTARKQAFFGQLSGITGHPGAGLPANVAAGETRA